MNFFLQFWLTALLLAPMLLLAQPDSDGHWQKEPIFYQLEQALDNPRLVFRLHIDDLNTEPDSLWAALPAFSNLKELTIQGEFFSSFPPELWALRQQLEILHIEENSLADWDLCFAKLSKFRLLHSLYLHRCSFGAELPQSLFQLQQLRNLSLANSPIQERSTAFHKLKRLEMLDLRSCELRSVPAELCKSRRLQILYLGNHPDGAPNQISSLPAELFSPKHKLNTLQLDQNPLKSIPSEIRDLHSLRAISLRSCAKLDGVATARLLTQCAQLERVDLAGISLKLLVGNLKNWQSLQTLDLSFCELSSLPDALLQLPELQQLILTGNQFSDADITRFRQKIPNVVR